MLPFFIFENLSFMWYNKNKQENKCQMTSQKT
jgi:hypothetical protein